MKIQKHFAHKSIKVPGLTIFCEDEDLLYPALMLIQLDHVLKYSQEGKKMVLVIPGDQPYTITKTVDHFAKNQT